MYFVKTVQALSLKVYRISKREFQILKFHEKIIHHRENELFWDPCCGKTCVLNMDGKIRHLAANKYISKFVSIHQDIYHHAYVIIKQNLHPIESKVIFYSWWKNRLLTFMHRSTIGIFVMHGNILILTSGAYEKEAWKTGLFCIDVKYNKSGRIDIVRHEQPIKCF